jgi:hypothetical protein
MRRLPFTLSGFPTKILPAFLFSFTWWLVIDMDSVLGLHCVVVDDDIDVSEVCAAFTFFLRMQVARTSQMSAALPTHMVQPPKTGINIEILVNDCPQIGE